ncbi:AI-2E family transporter [candidate division KSB1 bacterium]|nr:AI-2E family transporter [candidate division KSB1 bacterium]
MIIREEKKWRASTLRESRLTSLLLMILVIFAVGFILHQLQTIFKPLLIAIFLSFIFEPMVNFLTSIKIPKFFAFLISLIVVFVVFYLFGLIIYASVASFSQEFPKYQTKFVALYNGTLGIFKVPHDQVQLYIKQIKWADVWKNLSIPSLLSATVGTFISFLANLFLVLIFTIYIVLGKVHMLEKVSKAFPNERATRILDVITNINGGMQRYLITKTMISLGTGTVAALILFAFGVDFAIVWGLLTFLLNFIPNIGSVIATLPPILVTAFQFGDFLKIVWVAILLIGTQITMGNIIEPRVMGKNLNLSPLVVIFSLIFWGFIWGPVGMLLAVPISSTIQIICANIDVLKPVSIFMGGDDEL